LKVSGFLVPSWAASPVVLVAVGLFSASVPFWTAGAGGRDGEVLKGDGVVNASGEASGSGTSADPAASRAGSVRDFSQVPKTTRLSYLRQALERLASSPDGREAEGLGIQLRRCMLTLDADELEEVGALLAAVKRDRSQLQAVASAFSSRLAALRPDLAADLLMLHGGEADARQALAGLLDKSAVLDVLSRSALPEALRACEKDNDLKRRLITAWATHSPLAAMEYAEKMLPSAPEALDRADYLFPWMQHDPKGLVTWLDANAESHPQILERTNSIHAGGYARWIVQQMPRAEGISMTLGLRDPLIRNAFVSGLFNEYPPSEITGLAPLLQLRDGAKPLSVSGFLNKWRRKDGAAASTWAAGLPEGDLKTTALRVLATPLPDPKKP
jgi:hypothetical protein